MNEETLALMGAPGSPYTRKMLAVLRHRRLPYRLLIAGGVQAAALPAAKVPLLPTFFFRNAAGELEAATDSTPLIRRLEREHPGRNIIPADPALRMLDELIEDFADEWLTKAMFHYRWSYRPDIAKSGRQLPLWRNVSISDEALAKVASAISERQIGRLAYVGSNAVTGPVIEASYRRFLEAFETHLKDQPFLLGARPGAGDFAVFGQLTQLVAFDPTPMALAQEIAPRVCAWVSLVEDLSGLEPSETDWIDIAAPPTSLRALLAEIGRVYAPVMLANARALQSGDGEVRAQIDGADWTQNPFPYQGKCLAWLRASHTALEAADRARFDSAVAGSGCEALFT